MGKFSFDKVCSHFITSGYYFQGSEIYGGLSNTWDYGPLGSEIKNNIRLDYPCGRVRACRCRRAVGFGDQPVAGQVPHGYDHLSPQ